MKVTYGKDGDNTTPIVCEKKQVVVDREIDSIIQEKGAVDPNDLLERGRDPSNPLHKYFEWDDSVAGEKYRIVQATSMIMNSKIIAQIIESEKAAPESVPHSVPVRRLVSAFKGEGFKMRPEVLDEEETRVALVSKYTERLRSWLRATADIQELSHIRSAVERALGGEPKDGGGGASGARRVGAKRGAAGLDRARQAAR